MNYEALLRERWKVYEHYAIKCVLDWFRKERRKKIKNKVGN